MSQQEKLLLKLTKRPTPSDVTWAELVKYLKFLGFKQVSSGKTGGSRRKFINADGIIISLHEPHPRKVLKKYQVEQIIDLLEKEALL